MLAIESMHEDNLVHGNIKPSNILIEENVNGVVTFKLHDIIKLRDPSPFSNNGVYSAPESQNCICNAKSSPKLDSWSIGIIFYKFLTGKDY
jgi:serine/threonine protein kinase